MIYLLKFTDEAAAKIALPDWVFPASDDWLPLPMCGWLPVKVIEQAGVYNNLDLDNPVTVTPERLGEDYWLALDVFDAALAVRETIKSMPELIVSTKTALPNQVHSSWITQELEVARQRFNGQIKEYSARIADALTSKYSEPEIRAFGSKLLAAEAHLAGTATMTQIEILMAEAEILGITINDLAPLIQAKGSVLNKVVGAIAGFRRKTEAGIAVATTEYEMRQLMQASAVQAAVKLQSILGGN